MRSRFAKTALWLGMFSLITFPVLADTVAHNLAAGNFTQNWTDTNLITVNDSWSGVPSITGYLGEIAATSVTGVDPQTVLGPLGPIDVVANQTAPDTNISGGVSEFHITNPVVALQGSGTADHPNIIIYLNTTGRTTVNVSYSLRDVDCAADNAIQQVALQYRVGGTGNFTNVPAGFVTDASTGPSLCTAVTPVSVTLPAAVDNQASVEIRIISSNAVGSDEWIGIDDISVTSVTGGPPNNAPTITAPANPIATVVQGAAPFNVTLTGSDDLNIYAWSATAGSGIASVVVSGGQGTNSVTYSVTLQNGFSGTASFTAFLSDNVNSAVTQLVNIQVTSSGGGNLAPVITPPANPVTTVAQNAPPFTVSVSGSDDFGIFNWTATPGSGVASVAVTSGQGTATVTYTVTLLAGFNGTATFTASLSDNVNPAATATVNITVTLPPPSNHVTISQLYGGGGNTGATFANDYVELFNPTATAVNMTGWSIQYSSATATGPFAQIQPLGGIIGPSEYFLVGFASGGAVGSPLPTPNISGDINMSGTAGKVALVNNGQALDGGCGGWLADPDLVDFVGYGTANCSEASSNAAAPSNTTSLFRKSGGSTDTNVNGADFLTGTPAPRRTSPIQEIGPSVLNTDPSSTSTSAPRDASLVITFTEPVDVDANWFSISCVTTGAHADNVFREAFNRTWIIIPNTNFLAGERCTATIFATAVHDRDTDDTAPNTDTLLANYTWTFTVATGTPPPYPPDVNLAMGNPSGAVSSTSVPNNFLMTKPEITLSYNRDKGTPNWVSWHLADEWVGTLTRVDTFRPDPAIPSDWYRVLDSDYFGSGFDRGHMTPNADRDKETSIPINQATFLMSNILPQAPDNNQGPWANMENDLRALLPANELYIVSGGAGIGGTGTNGLANTIVNGRVTVPASTWKVVLVLPKAAGDDVARVDAMTRTIAVIMPNTQGIRTNDWRTYIVSVDQVETLTGYDFFSNVSDAIENAIEAGVNGTNPPGAANLSVSTREDVPRAITLEGVSSNGTALTYTIVTPPARGTLTGTGASRTYTPAADFNGTDTFTYRVNNGTDSNLATVTVTMLEVNDPPAAAADTKTATTNTTLVFAASDLTANDTAGPANESGQTLTVTSVAATASTQGTVTLSGGQVTYVPAANYTGPASFTYTVCDNGVSAGLSDSLCATATVNLTVGTGGVRGDPDGNGTTSVADVFYLINFLFTNGPGPVGSGDANGDGTVTVADVFYLINFLFTNGPAPR